MRNKVFGKAVLLVLLAVFLAVLVEYFMFTGDAGEVVRQYMELDSAGNIQSSKAAFANYAYQLVERTGDKVEEVSERQLAMGQALADAAYGEYLLYQQEKERRGGSGFGSWIYADWFRGITRLDAAGKTYDDVSGREAYASDSQAWCAMFYSCMAQSVQRGSGGALLYGSLCEMLYSQYCMTDASVVVYKDSYFMEHMERAGKSTEDFYRYVARYCEDETIARNKIVFMEYGSFVPQPGDLVFFHWSTDTLSVSKWITHIGIVYDYDAETGNVTVVEGNRNGNHNATRSEVACTVYQDNAGTWALDKKNFIGYVRPAY